MSAIRKLAVEATDNGMLHPDIAAGTLRVNHKKITVRNGGLKLMKKSKIWCGEGDLNPHDLSIASTST